MSDIHAVAPPAGAVAVIFISRRNQSDPEGYDAASAAMDEEAARQPGYIAIESVREPGGEGITVSLWEDEASALAWRDHAAHAAIRARGRADWYDRYHVIVATVTRDYRWARREG